MRLVDYDGEASPAMLGSDVVVIVSAAC